MILKSIVSSENGNCFDLFFAVFFGWEFVLYLKRLAMKVPRENLREFSGRFYCFLDVCFSRVSGMLQMLKICYAKCESLACFF